MSLTTYPTDGYNSWVIEEEADEYFETRIHAAEWKAGDSDEHIAALRTAFVTLSELNIDLTDLDSEDQDEVDAILDRLKKGQLEQAAWEIKAEAETQDVSQVGLGGLLQVSFGKKDSPDRFAPRAMGLLRPYLYLNTITRVR